MWLSIGAGDFDEIFIDEKHHNTRYVSALYVDGYELKDSQDSYIYSQYLQRLEEVEKEYRPDGGKNLNAFVLRRIAATSIMIGFVISIVLGCAVTVMLNMNDSGMTPKLWVYDGIIFFILWVLSSWMFAHSKYRKMFSETKRNHLKEDYRRKVLSLLAGGRYLFEVKEK